MSKLKNQPKPEVSCPADVREIRLLATSFYELQAVRIQINNRIAMLKRDYGLDLIEATTMHNNVFPRIQEAEDAIEKRAREYARQYPVFTEWIGPHVKGVAETLTAGLIAGIRDISRFDTVSKLWKYCGVGIRADGSIQKRVKGQKVDYSPFLKTLCYKLGEQFVKIGDRGYYGLKYQEFKADEQKKAQERGLKILPQADIDKLKDDQKAATISEGHIHNRTKRKVAKLFLSHLWEVWRTLEKLPVRPPYVTGIKTENHPFTHHRYEPPPGFEKSAD